MTGSEAAALRAAQFSIYANSRLGPQATRLFPEALQPMPLARAVSVLKSYMSPRPEEKEAMPDFAKAATAQLSAGVQSFPELRPYASLLAGPALLGDMEQKLQERRERAPRPLQAEQPVQQELRTQARLASLDVLMPSALEAQPRGWILERSVQLDPVTLVTTARVVARYKGDLKLLARGVNPISWSRLYPEFWPASYRVKPRDGQLLKDPVQPGPDEDWEGLLCEVVELSWNESIISSFENYLRVRMHVGEDSFAFSYSEYFCEGALLLLRLSAGGIDVDRGFYRARREEDGFIHLEVEKNVRFMDLTSRLTAFQGLPEGGQVLNYNAPSWVGLWMDRLVIHALEEWSRGGEGRMYG